MSKVFAIIGRAFLGLIFVFSGWSKLIDGAGTSQALSSVGLSPDLAIPTGIFELVAGLCLALGFMVRLTALLLIIFTALTILFFHRQFTDPVQGIAALKNIAIIGGLFLAFAHSQMWSHYYAIRVAREGEVAKRDLEQKLHEAEIRSARAEASAEESRRHAIAAHPYETSPAVIPTHRRWFDW